MSLFKEKPKTEREKVEKRREEVLAKGRKFKYPMQYAKHKLIINTIIVALVAIILMVGAGWAMLYKLQDTGDMIYRVTQLIPVPVAEVDGEKVRYSDYLMIYRSNLLTAEQQGGQSGEGEDDVEVMRAQYRQAAMDLAVEYTYALKLAGEMGITVTDEEVDEAFDEHLRVGGVERSEEAFLKIVSDNFGMNKAEYRRMLYLTLIRAKVVQAVDNEASEAAGQVDQMLAENGGDLLAVADALGEVVIYEETGDLVDNMNVDGGRSTKAMSLEPGQVSEKFLSSNGDGYYYVKLNEKTDSQVNYASLKISFMTFDEQVLALYADGKVEVFINLELPEGDDERMQESQNLPEGQGTGEDAVSGGE